MENNLLIIGAGIYGAVAEEIAMQMGCFDKIDYVDDFIKKSVSGKKVICSFNELKQYQSQYQKIIVAIGNAAIRESLFQKIKDQHMFDITTLISPNAYVSPSAKISSGCVIEPMAVIHMGACINEGCFISANAVIDHGSVCEKFVHVACNATVKGNTVVPQCKKIESNQVF